MLVKVQKDVPKRILMRKVWRTRNVWNEEPTPLPKSDRLTKAEIHPMGIYFPDYDRDTGQIRDRRRGFAAVAGQASFDHLYFISNKLK